ncbi:MAG: dimethylmenaquinone methyltransferase [Deltaproteobacteria bacterium]|jgi:RNA polymerase-binding transcription factor DksA|nr:dimethylmenaquinone methyltransferase [Deltaproteobacteria bacterium]
MDHGRLKSQLEEREALLRRRVDRVERDLQNEHSTDWQEQATERENEPVLEALDEKILAELEEIGLALRRLEEGNYGVCVTCEEEIPAARLDALPTTTRCVSCVD